MAGRYSVEDFGKLRWLEGSWHGRLPEGGHFYERYRVVDDSTIAMRGFPDSTFAHATDSARITLRGGTVADEGSARWVATRLDSDVVDFASERNAANNFTWARESQDRWTATLRSSDRQGRAQTTVYPMERIGPRLGVVFDPSRANVLEGAAKDIVGFLRGDVGFEEIRLADTVTLYLSPEGGGTRTTFTREQLRKPSNWVIHSGRQIVAFAPSGRLTKLTAKAGSHFNCLEYPLASRFPDLAKQPHVGVKLEPDSPRSCLESWNATFVFNASDKPPRLVAAVYDQWEW